MREYRLWITIPDLPLGDEDLWEPLIEHLEANYGPLGPAMGWDENVASIVVAVDADSEASAVQQGIEAVTASLHAVDLGDHYPSSVTVEPVSEDEPIPA